MIIPLSLGSYTGRSKAANTQSLLNVFPETDMSGGVSPFILTRRPGLSRFVSSDYAREARGAIAWPGKILCAFGKKTYEVDIPAETITYRGDLDTTEGFLQFAENPDQILIVDGTYGYYFNKSTGALLKITDADFPTPKACTWKDGYGVVVEDGTGKMYVSAINDFSSWDALDFTTAEFEPDNLVGCISTPDSLIALGEKTTQFYYNSGNSSYPFDPRQGANMQIGCGAKDSAVSRYGFTFWIDDSGQVRILNGYVPTVVSTPQIDYRISQLSTFSNATGHIYTQEGHTFYMLNFPSDRLTLVYDVVTSQWHERTSYADNSRYRAAWVAQDGVDVFAGDFTNGRIYKLDSGTYTDNTSPMMWRFTTQAVHGDNNMLQHKLFEIKFDFGVGDTSDPQVWMQYSDDDGHSWSRENWRGLGKEGEFARRARWYALGISRNRTYRVGGTDAYPMNAVMARLEAEPLGY